MSEDTAIAILEQRLEYFKTVKDPTNKAIEINLAIETIIRSIKNARSK